MITVTRQISKDLPAELPKLVITKKFSITKLLPRILTEGGLQDTSAVIIQKGPSHFVPVPLVQTSPGVFVLGTSLADTVNISMNPGVSTSDSTSSGETKTLFDFTDNGITDLKNWREISDTVRDVGMSKASFVVQKTQKFQRAVFFTMLNPQPNGAGFAGVSTSTPFNLQKFQNVLIHARAQGSVTDYKIVLRHKGLNQEPHPTYEQTFNVPLNEFTTISLPLSNFDPYYRGRKLNSSEAEPLDTSQISSFGFQVYGGVYHPKKQSGISAFEVDWVKAK
nr:PREDICTED: uncharacterized protein LOC109031427 [Bemisia tabaci]